MPPSSMLALPLLAFPSYMQQYHLCKGCPSPISLLALRRDVHHLGGLSWHKERGPSAVKPLASILEKADL